MAQNEKDNLYGARVSPDNRYMDRMPQEKLDLLPWTIVDGMNEKGLVVNSNVVPKADWGEVQRFMSATRKLLMRSA